MNKTKAERQRREGGQIMSHEIMVLIKVEDDADYKAMQKKIADFPEVIDVSVPIPVFQKEVK